MLIRIFSPLVSRTLSALYIASLTSVSEAVVGIGSNCNVHSCIKISGGVLEMAWTKFVPETTSTDDDPRKST